MPRLPVLLTWHPYLQFSCSSQCCSTQPCQEEDCSATQPCQEEDCSGDGTPCNEIGCFDGMELNMPPEWDSQASIVQQQQPQRHQPPPPPLYSDFHDHPCNHTHTEHDVAMTLKNLNNKIGLSSHQQSDFSDAPTISDENQHLVACSDGSLSESLGAHEQLSHSDVSGSTPQPCASVSAQQRCVCKWVMNPGAPVSQQRVCGNICSSNHDLVEHLKTNHIAMMTAKTHIVCSWKGCKRTGDQVFASRNKLTRHLFTHTGCK
ncbi:hypothetical protein GGR56DRAFT_207759 [Xylariaceae sp. FL0804]|nr:hypothetical protein GGR56DRAFT_207759 [Xylariaceae sp. FL0804]